MDAMTFSAVQFLNKWIHNSVTHKYFLQSFQTCSLPASHVQSHTSTITVNATSWTTSHVVKGKKKFFQQTRQLQQDLPWAFQDVLVCLWYSTFHVHTAFVTELYWCWQVLQRRRKPAGKEKKVRTRCVLRKKKSDRMRGCLSGFILSRVSSFQLCLIPFIRTWKASRDPRSALFWEGYDLKKNNNNVFQCWKKVIATFRSKMSSACVKQFFKRPKSQLRKCVKSGLHSWTTTWKTNEALFRMKFSPQTWKTWIGQSERRKGRKPCC